MIKAFFTTVGCILLGLFFALIALFGFIGMMGLLIGGASGQLSFIPEQHKMWGLIFLPLTLFYAMFAYLALTFYIAWAGIKIGQVFFGAVR